MQLASYRTQGHTDGSWRAGVEYEGSVVDIAALWHDGIHEMTTRQLLAAGPATVHGVFKQASKVLNAGPDASGVFQTASVELGPPVPASDKIMCLGVNYREHAAEAQQQLPAIPMLFAKSRNSLIGPSSPILLPCESTQFDYERELAVIIGTRCKEVSEQEALQYVAGYTLMNYVSARDGQMQTSQWTAGKALDTFAPMGPGIIPAANISDSQTLMLTTRVNGQVVQHTSSANMIFSVSAAIAFLSSLMTLEPGDIIATGTPSGTTANRYRTGWA